MVEIRGRKLRPYPAASFQAVVVSWPASGEQAGEVRGSAGLRLGADGEHIALPERAAVSTKPRNMTFAQAAAVPLGGLNALHFMRRASLKPGEQVLINGAGGSIGAHAVQIAHSMGARVTAVDHRANG